MKIINNLLARLYFFFDKRTTLAFLLHIARRRKSLFHLEIPNVYDEFTPSRTFTSSLGRHVFLVERDGSTLVRRTALETAKGGPLFARVVNDRKLSNDRVHIPRVYVFLPRCGRVSSVREIRRVRVQRNKRRQDFHLSSPLYPTLSSRTIVKPPLPGHINTSTSVPSSTVDLRPVDTPDPFSSLRTLVILDNERQNHDQLFIAVRFVEQNYLSVFFFLSILIILQ